MGAGGQAFWVNVPPTITQSCRNPHTDAEMIKLIKRGAPFTADEPVPQFDYRVRMREEETAPKLRGPVPVVIVTLPDGEERAARIHHETRFGARVCWDPNPCRGSWAWFHDSAIRPATDEESISGGFGPLADFKPPQRGKPWTLNMGDMCADVHAALKGRCEDLSTEYEPVLPRHIVEALLRRWLADPDAGLPI